ncbi:MAG: hypothetical protein CM1200mP12_01800 [Gammaproteobacteria bacterium]|nr:MAG: hypothetical protein CM1200mP12_01800 [Gammaproteobacteria bacterium]
MPLVYTRGFRLVLGNFEKFGFRGGLILRNIERNWKLTEDFKITVLKFHLFLAGSQDMVIGGADKEALEGSMKEVIPLLEEVSCFPIWSLGTTGSCRRN